MAAATRTALAAAASQIQPQADADRKQAMLAAIGKILLEYQQTGDIADVTAATNAVGALQAKEVSAPEIQTGGFPPGPPQQPLPTGAAMQALPPPPEPATGTLDITADIVRAGGVVPGYSNKQMANSSTHPREYGGFRRFCEKNAGSSMQVVKAWEWGAQPLLHQLHVSFRRVAGTRNECTWLLIPKHIGSNNFVCKHVLNLTGNSFFGWHGQGRTVTPDWLCFRNGFWQKA